MNNFTKEELGIIACNLCINSNTKDILNKLKVMISNYREDPWNTRKIAESHLREAESLISHAICLLRMKEDV